MVIIELSATLLEDSAEASVEVHSSLNKSQNAD